MNATQKAIAYLRVSTRKQGASGLGLEAQREAVARYAAAHGLTVAAEYLEVESSRRDDLANRPQLRNALAHARRSGAVLVIAKLDRLARSVFVTAELMKSGVEFVCCDNPHANRMTIQILAVMAENESIAISERTKAAMAAAKARGRVFGRPMNLDMAARLKGALKAAEGRTQRAAVAYNDLLPIVAPMRERGDSLSTIAKALNALGHTTCRQRPWTKVQVSRVLGRCGAVA